MTTTEL